MGRSDALRLCCPNFWALAAKLYQARYAVLATSLRTPWSVASTVYDCFGLGNPFVESLLCCVVRALARMDESVFWTCDAFYDAFFSIRWWAHVVGGGLPNVLALRLVVRRSWMDIARSNGCVSMLGLRWRAVTGTIPVDGIELVNAELAVALQVKLDLNTFEWDRFKIHNLTARHFVRVRGENFQPDTEGQEELACRQVGHVVVDAAIEQISSRLRQSWVIAGGYALSRIAKERPEWKGYRYVQREMLSAPSESPCSFGDVDLFMVANPLTTVEPVCVRNVRRRTLDGGGSVVRRRLSWGCQMSDCIHENARSVIVDVMLSVANLKLSSAGEECGQMHSIYGSDGRREARYGPAFLAETVSLSYDRTGDDCAAPRHVDSLQYAKFGDGRTCQGATCVKFQTIILYPHPPSALEIVKRFDMTQVAVWLSGLESYGRSVRLTLSCVRDEWLRMAFEGDGGLTSSALPYDVRRGRTLRRQRCRVTYSTYCRILKYRERGYRIKFRVCPMGGGDDPGICFVDLR